MKFTSAALLLLLPAFTFGMPNPSAEPSQQEVDAPIDERDNVLEARDATCWVNSGAAQQDCRSSTWSGEGHHVGWLRPYPATFGSSCFAVGSLIDSWRFYYYVPAYKCYVNGANINSGCASKVTKNCNA